MNDERSPQTDRDTEQLLELATMFMADPDDRRRWVRIDPRPRRRSQRQGAPTP